MPVSLFGYISFAAFCLLMIAGAVIDARERRFPNVLAFACAVSACCTVGSLDLRFLAARMLYALALCVALLSFEVLWRRLKGAAGLGFGDIKAFFSLAVIDPIIALISLCAALMLLAVAGLLFHKPSLPLLPFLVPSFAIIGDVHIWFVLV